MTDQPVKKLKGHAAKYIHDEYWEVICICGWSEADCGTRAVARHEYWCHLQVMAKTIQVHIDPGSWSY